MQNFDNTHFKSYDKSFLVRVQVLMQLILFINNSIGSITMHQNLGCIQSTADKLLTESNLWNKMSQRVPSLSLLSLSPMRGSHSP